jgi:hypothetical protein
LTQFAHIAPSAYLSEFAEGPDSVYVMDNSAFEMYKQGRDMYPSEKLVEMGKQVQADYIVLTDYPGEPWRKTIEAAERLAPEFRDAGFGTFFCPQSEVGNFPDLLRSYYWAVNEGKDLVDYIGVSILGVPNAFGVERDNKLQRFNSRWAFMRTLYQLGLLQKMRDNGQKLHFLGMVDGPHEIALVEAFLPYIDSWDSSAAVWAGLNSIRFDFSPTGLINGKFEKEVDFDHPLEAASAYQIGLAHIDTLLDQDNSLTRLS